MSTVTKKVITMPDKYSAVWVSHSSISDFLNCPRAYFLNNVYRDPKTGHKIQLMAPALALGGAVHEVLESLSVLPSTERFKEPLVARFTRAWKRVAGRRGGFTSTEQEDRYRRRGEEMLHRVTTHPGPLMNKAVKIQQDLPQYWLSEADNIILCGKIDWLEYLPDSDTVHIIDFKTSKSEERESSLQLPIYHLLVANTQGRQVSKASYWYIALNDELTPKELPDLAAAHEQVLEIAKKMKLARQLERFKCSQGDGCYHCKPLEKIIRGEAEFVGENDYRQDVYIIDENSEAADQVDSVIL